MLRVVDEATYWGRLEYRVCRELAGLRDEGLGAWWCDGFIVEGSDAVRGCVVGRVWMGRGGRHQEAWGFELVLGRAAREGGGVDWDVLLPGEGVTGWLSVDVAGKMMKVDPGAAYPDGEARPG